MNNYTPSFQVSVADIDAQQLESALKFSIPSGQVSFSINTENTSNERGLFDFIDVILANSVAASVVAAIIYDIIKTSIKQLPAKRQKIASTIIILNNGIEVVLRSSMGSKELNEKIQWCMDNGGIKEIYSE